MKSGNKENLNFDSHCYLPIGAWNIIIKNNIPLAGQNGWQLRAIPQLKEIKSCLSYFFWFVLKWFMTTTYNSSIKRNQVLIKLFLLGCIEVVYDNYLQFLN